MNIGLDARKLTDRKDGIGYYLYNLLQNILELDHENQYYLFSDREIVFEKSKYKNVQFIQDSNSKIFKKSIWYAFKMHTLIKKFNIDVFWGTQHVLPFNVKKSVKTVLTMHDLVAYEMPETMNSYNKFINRLMIPASLNRADNIIAVSKSTEQGIIKYFPKLDRKKITVIYEDSEVVNVSTEEEECFFAKQNEINKKKYIFYIGTIEPRKNTERLLKAFDMARESCDLKLVLAGKIGWKADEFFGKIDECKYKKDILYLDYVSDKDKAILLKNCFAFVFPSLYEGFGLPVVEAMKSDAIPLVSNCSSLDELVEIDDMKFDPLNIQEIANSIIKIYEDTELYNKCLDYSMSRAKDFDWNKFAKLYIKEFTL